MTLLDSQPNGGAATTPDTRTAPDTRSAPDHGPSASRDDSVRELVHRLSEQTSHLVRAEAALAKLEAKQRAKVIGIGIGTFGAGGLIAFFGMAAGVTAAILGLSNVMRPWLAAIVVAAGCFLLALFIVAPGWKGIRDRRGVPENVVDSVKSDVAAVREAAHR